MPLNICAYDIEDMAFWLSLDVERTHMAWRNNSWIPNYPMWSYEPMYKADIRQVAVKQEVNILKQLHIAHDIYNLKLIWNGTSHGLGNMRKR